MDQHNLAIVRQSFANTVFTHKVQEVAAERCEKKIFMVKVANIALVSVVLILLFLQAAFPTKVWLVYLGAAITIAEIIFLIIQLTFSFDQQLIAHKNSALKYMSLRDNYRNLITDLMNEEGVNPTLVSRRDELQHRYQVISDLAPQTSQKDYIAAQGKLNKRGAVEGEEFTWADEEIDHFLPHALRVTKQ